MTLSSVILLLILWLIQRLKLLYGSLITVLLPLWSHKSNESLVLLLELQGKLALIHIVSTLIRSEFKLLFFHDHCLV